MTGLRTTIFSVLLMLLLSHVGIFRLKSSAPGKEKITFENIGLEKGLSQISVNTIAQDSNGFMWFGTQDGLNKYDGYDFTVYKHDPLDQNSLSDGHIRFLHADNNGTLWVGTYNSGLNKFDPETDTFTRYRHAPNDAHSLSHDEVSVIYRDGAGTLWVGTWGGGLERFNSETGRFKHYRRIPDNPDSLGADFVKAIYEDRAGTLWIGTHGGGLNKFDRTTGAFTRYVHDRTNPDGISNNYVTCIYETRAREMWIGTDGGGLNRLDREKETFSRYIRQNNNRAGFTGLSHNTVNFIHEDKEGMVWIGTDRGGLNIFDPRQETFSHYRYDRQTPGTLSHDRLLSIYEDNTGMLWIGTYGGIDKFDPERMRFHYLKSDPSASNGLHDSDIRAIFEDSHGTLWIGTYSGGLTKIDRKTGAFVHYAHNPRSLNSLSANRIFAISGDRTGTLWFGTPGSGLMAFDRRTGIFTHYRHNPDEPGSLSSNKVRSIYHDSTGRLWIGTMGGGLNRFEPRTKTFYHYRHKPGEPSGISSNKVFPIHEDKAGILWIGTFGGGLNRFDPKTGIFTHYRHTLEPPGKGSGLSSDRVFSIHEDGAGILWVGTDGGGLNRFDRETGKWRYFLQKDGLPSNVIYGILEDGRGRLWLSTTRGLSKYSPVTQTFHNYGVSDGLRYIEFNSGAYYKSPLSGEMFFGGVNGVNSFFPDSFSAGSHINPVVITVFKKFTKTVGFNRSTAKSEGIRLSHRDNFFSFEFVAPEFRIPDNNQYFYKLEGFDRDWIRNGTRRYAIYTNVPGGKYQFRVKSANQEGVESETRLMISIMPPFWQTTWFMVLAAVFVLLTVFALNQLRTYSIRKRNRELESINIKLNREIAERQQAELLQSILYKIAGAAHSDMSSEEIYRVIHKAIGRLISAKNFYIALFEPGEGSIYFPYFIDEFNDYMGHTLKASRGITQYIIRKGISILASKKMLTELADKKGLQLVGDLPETWLGVPLKFKDEIFGAVVAQHYSDPDAYTEKDKEVLEFVSAQIAGVIHRKRQEEEKKALKEKLVVSEKMEAVGRLAGGVAHDLNNVLSAIVSYPELLLMKLPKDSPLRKPLQTMKRSGQRAAAIVQDLLTLARRGIDVKEVVSWNDIIHDYLRSPVFEMLNARHPNVKIETSLQKDLLNIEGSPVHLTKALMNLCTNAAEAIPKSRKGTISLVTVNLYADETIAGYNIGNYVVVSISDDGVGIAEADLKRVFEPFYTRKEMGISGTGLGMAIVWNTVQDHNGHINTASKVGQGTTFELYFPVTREAVSKKQKKIGIKEFMGHGECILVIDDVPEQREILNLLLIELGYSVVTASCGEEAVGYMKNHPSSVDLLVLDMIMGKGIDGLETFKRIRQLQPGIKAVIASGFSETMRVKETVKLGAGAYIKKPYTLEMIGLAIKKELEK
ncbi:MAG: response regulator [bacterium]|nr:response regulator [bacterium]